MNSKELVEKLYKIRESDNTPEQKSYLIAPILCDVMGITQLELSQSVERLAVVHPELIECYVGVLRWCNEQSEVVK